MSRILFAIVIAFMGSSGVRMAPPPSPESGEEIVAHYVEALGGKEHLQGLNSIHLEGVALLPSGLQVTARIWRVYDRLYRMELDYGESHIILVATPGRGWTINPGTDGEVKSITGEDLKALRVEIDPAGPLADYNAKGFKVQRVGLDTVNSEPCYKVKVSCPSNHSITYSIDAKTYYVLKEVRRGGGIVCGGSLGGPWNNNADNEVTVEYGDYKKGPGGYVLPYSISVNGIGAPIIIQKVEINKTVDVESLSRPK
jgi:hypothetical protein